MPVGKGRFLDVLPNEHIEAAPGLCKSVSYRLVEKRRRLLDEHRHLSGLEIGALKKELGEESVTREVCRPLLGFSGDGASPNAELWYEVPCLIHEATFLSNDETSELAVKHRHCRLPDVLLMAEELECRTLILGHFSTRYSHEQILEAVESERAQAGYKGEVLLALPGEMAQHRVEG